MNPKSTVPLLLGAASGAALVVRERRARSAVERVAAAALETLLNAIEANDADTGQHVRRVATYALIIGGVMGLDDRQCHALERVALFHDIGKVHEALFDVVHEGRRLTRDDRRAIATHPLRGAEVLAPLRAFYPELPEGVLAHHEWWNGCGYPRRLRGQQIPLTARIVTIADTFDAVAFSRRYRAGSGAQAALDTIARGRGTQFDPELVDLVLFPPVAERLTDAYRRARRERRGTSRPHGGGRREHQREPVPDVTFRWRSESLGSGQLRGARRAD